MLFGNLCGGYFAIEGDCRLEERVENIMGLEGSRESIFVCIAGLEIIQI
jgi:hypothetical protein